MKKKITPKFIFSNLDAIICGTTLTLCVILVNVNVAWCSATSSITPSGGRTRS